MSDLRVDATPTPRNAPSARSARATARDAADLTAAFDHIFANTAKTARNNSPKTSQSAPAAPLEALPPKPAKPDFEPAHEEPADEAEPAASSVHPVAQAAIETSPSRDAPSPRQLAAPAPAPSTLTSAANTPVAKAPSDAPSVKERRTDSLGARRERESHSNPRSAKPTAEQPLDNPAKGRAASSVRPKGTTENVAERVEPVAKVESQEVAQRSNLPAKASTAAAQPAAAKPVGNAQRETAKINDPDAKVKAREVASPPQAKSAPQPAAPPPAQRAEAATKIAPAKEKADAPATQRPNAEQPRHDSVVAKPAAKLKGETHAREHEAPRKADNPLEKVAVTAEGAADKAERTDPEAPRNSQAAAHQNAAASRVTTPPRETEHAKKQQVEAPQVAIAEQPDAVRQAEPKRIREPRVSTSTASEAKPTATGAAPIAKAAETPQIVPTVPGVATAAPPSATTQTVATTVKSEATVEGARPSGNTSAATENAAAPTTSGVEPHEKSRGATAEGGKTANVKRPISDQQQEVERVRLVQRVAKALQTAQDRGGTLRIRLTPPELGALKIELIVRDGALSAKLEAETPAAKQAILENLPALRERLTAQEIKIERFDVDLMQQSDHSGGERQSFADADTAREHTAQRQATWNNERGGAKASGAKPETSIRAPLSSGRLNVLA